MITINSVDELRRYFSPLMGRADHHAQMVEEVVLSVMGGIIATKDEGTDIQVRERNGRASNMLWVYINGHRYVFCYVHGDGDGTTGIIEVRDRTQQGDVVISLNNHTTPTQVLRLFKSLNPGAFEYKETANA